jgi:hypothetical protein
MKEKYLHGKFFVPTKFFFKKLFFPHFKRSNLWLSTFSHFHMPKRWVLWSVEITITSQTFMNPIMTVILSACKGVGKAIYFSHLSKCKMKGNWFSAKSAANEKRDSFLNTFDFNYFRTIFVLSHAAFWSKWVSGKSLEEVGLKNKFFIFVLFL